VVESQLPKLLVAGSIPVSRSKLFPSWQSSIVAVQQETLAVVLASEDQQQRESSHHH
jgi:hypothetical protein